MATPSTARRRPQPARDTKQQRSRQTLERILDAAEEILDERDFDELTMAELARRAGCAVGTLYGRLPNKESLLVCLHERFQSAGIAASETAFAACRGQSLEARVQALCRLIVDYVCVHRGVTRAVTAHLFGRAGTDTTAFRREATVALRQAAAFLAEKVDGRVHPDAQQACEFAVIAALELAQSRLVFAERSSIEIRYSRKQLEARLAAMVTAYLRHGGVPRPAQRAKAPKKTPSKKTPSKKTKSTHKNKRSVR